MATEDAESRPGWLGWLYYYMLVLKRWELMLLLILVSMGIHTVAAYAIEPAVHHTAVGALIQSLMLFWGLWFYVAMGLASQVTEVERRHERVTVAVDNVARLLGLLQRYLPTEAIGPESGYAKFIEEWHAVLMGSASMSHRGAARALLDRRSTAEDLERSLSKACFPEGLSTSGTDIQLELRDDLMLLLIQRIQEFRAEAFVDLETNNIVLMTIFSSTVAGLPTFLNALEVMRRGDDPDSAIKPQGTEYWVLAALLSVFSAVMLTFIIHGNFCLRYNGKHYKARSQKRLYDTSGSSASLTKSRPGGTRFRVRIQ